MNIVEGAHREYKSVFHHRMKSKYGPSGASSQVSEGFVRVQDNVDALMSRSDKNAVIFPPGRCRMDRHQ